MCLNNNNYIDVQETFELNLMQKFFWHALTNVINLDIAWFLYFDQPFFFLFLKKLFKQWQNYITANCVFIKCRGFGAFFWPRRQVFVIMFFALAVLFFVPKDNCKDDLPLFPSGGSTSLNRSTTWRWSCCVGPQPPWPPLGTFRVSTSGGRPGSPSCVPGSA